MTALYKINPEHSGIELYFAEKPAANIIDRLKADRWRWHRVKQCWYTKHTEKAAALAQTITNGEIKASKDEPSPAAKPSKAPAYYARIADYLSPDEYRAKLQEFYTTKGVQRSAFLAIDDAVKDALQHHYNAPDHLKRYIRQAIVYKSLGGDPGGFHCNGDDADYYAIWDKLPTLQGLKPTGESYAAVWGYDQTQITTATHYGRAFGFDALLTGGYGGGEVLLKRIGKNGSFSDGCRYFMPNRYTDEKVRDTNEHDAMHGR